MAQVRHENVVQLRGVCLDLGHLCLLMEYVERGSVLDVLRAHPDLPLWRRFELLRGAERAMHWMHTFKGTPLLHRDLKPENLLVTEGWVCKVADFGLASGIGASGLVSTAKRTEWTYQYVAPEVVEAGAARERETYTAAAEGRLLAND